MGQVNINPGSSDSSFGAGMIVGIILLILIVLVLIFYASPQLFGGGTGGGSTPPSIAPATPSAPRTFIDSLITAVLA